MATEIPVLKTSNHTADADLSAKQYFQVKDTATGIALCAAATDRASGVLQNNPKQGEIAVVMRIGQTKIVAGGVIARGAQLGTDAAGRADAKIAGTDTTEYVIGSALEAAAASGEIISAVISAPTAFRAV